MSITPARALARYAVSRNFSRAVHVVGLTSLAGAAVQLLSLQVAEPDRALWPALLCLVPMMAALVLLDRVDRAITSILYILVGTASVYGYTLTLEIGLDIAAQSASLSLPQIALIMAGASGVGAVAGLRSCVVGYIAAVGATGAAQLQATGAARFDPVSTGVFLVTAFVLVLAYLNQRRTERIRSRFTRAATDELVATLRYRLEVKAAAMMHDTVLSHLAAIAIADGDRLAPALADRIRQDLALLASGEWLEETPDRSAEEREDWRGGPIYGAIREARALGLEVGVTGDTAASLRLDCERAVEVGRAVKQCLVNVQRHAGTTDAEVAIYGSDDELLVMVVDTGDGFSAAEGDSDRMGLKTSIRGRIESLGGSVQVWSTPGRGTSIVLRVPIVESTASDTSPALDGQRR